MTNIHSIIEIANLPDNSSVVISGIIRSIRRIPTVKDPTEFLIYGSIEDSLSKIGFIAKPDISQKYNSLLESENKVIIRGKYNKTEYKYSVIILEDVMPYNEKLKNNRFITIFFEADVILTDGEQECFALKYVNLNPEFMIIEHLNDYQMIKEFAMFCSMPIINSPELVKDLLINDKNAFNYLEAEIIKQTGNTAAPEYMVQEKQEREIKLKRATIKEKLIFDYLYKENEEYAKVSFNKKYGIINNKLEWIIKPKYDNIHLLTSDKLLATLNNNVYVIDYSDNILKKLDIDSADTIFLKQPFILAEKNGKKILIDYVNDISILLDYEFSTIHCDNCYSDENIIYFCVKSGNNYGVIDKNNNIIIPFEYEKEICVDYAIISKKIENEYKYGIVNYKNEIVIPLVYKNIETFTCDDFSLKEVTFAAERFDGKTIIIDCNNKQICEINFDSINTISNKYYPAYIDNKYGAIDRFGNIKLPFEYDFIDSFDKINDSDKTAGLIINENDESSLIDIEGNIIQTLPCNYYFDDFYSFSYWLYKDFIILKVHNSEYMGVIDRNNNILIDFIYDDWIDSFGDYFFVKIENNCGILDKNGEVVNIYV